MNKAQYNDDCQIVFRCHCRGLRNKVFLSMINAIKGISRISNDHKMNDTACTNSTAMGKMSEGDASRGDSEAPVRRSSRIRRTVVKKDKPISSRSGKKPKSQSQGVISGLSEQQDGSRSSDASDETLFRSREEKKQMRELHKNSCPKRSPIANSGKESANHKKIPGSEFISDDPKDANSEPTLNEPTTGMEPPFLKATDDSSSHKNEEVKPVKVKSRWWRSSELESVLKTAEIPVTSSPDRINEDAIDPVSGKDTNKAAPLYQHIDENIYRFNRKKSKCKKQVRRMVCDCSLTKEELESGVMGCKEDCLNRLLMIECGSRCPIGEACSNRNFQKKQSAKVELFLTEKKGWGLCARECIPVGDFVLEFVGEVLNHKEYRQRVKQYAKEKNVHSYFMALKTDEILDATSKGNYSRFINHSCDPNCETQKWTVNGELRVGVFAKRVVNIGEELTLDYKFQRYGREAQKCFCGSDNCSGFIGGSKTISIDAFRGNNKLRKRKSSDDKKRDMEDFILEEEIEKLNGSSGLRNKEDTLNFSRLMIRAEDATTRHQLLDIILKTEEQACLRLFLGYHGLPLLWSWMTDVAEPELKVKILQVLSLLPITNKTMLLDSKVMSIIEKWKADPGEALQPVPVASSEDALVKRSKVSEFSDSENDSTGSQTGNSTVLEGPANSEESSAASSINTPMESSETKAAQESSPNVNIVNLASELLDSWKNLKEVFRIPRLEQQKRKENELEVEMNSKKNVTTSPAPQPSFGVHNKCGDHIQVVISGKNVQDQRRSYDYDLPEVKGEDFLRRTRSPILAKPRHHPIRSVDSYSRPDMVKGSPENPSPTLAPVSPLLPDPAPVITYPPSVSLPPPMAAGNASSLVYSSPVMYSQSQMPFVNTGLPPSAPPVPPLLQQPSPHPPAGNYLLLPPVARPPSVIPSQPPPFIPLAPGMPPFGDQSSSLFLMPPQPVTNTPAQENIPFQPTPVPVSLPAAKEEPKPVKLPKNWRTATDEEGNVYYYHSITRETQWDPPSEEDKSEDEESSSEESTDTPTYDEPKVISAKKKLKKRKTTKAAADTSVAPVRPEVAKKIKELFRTKISSFIVHCLNAYRKPSCTVGRITSNEDFKYLARKLTHYTMTKELKQCKNVEDLDCNETVMHKAKDFIKKYMAKYGSQYVRKEKGSPPV